MPGLVLILCDDLIFSSKITATARAHSLPAATVRTQAALLSRSAEAACVVIDLHNSTLDWARLIPALGYPRPMMVGFGSHVDVETLKTARAAGCDLVMPRSQFVIRLEEDLPRWAAG